MELGQHHLHGRHLLAIAQVHHIHGNAAAVVDHGNRVIEVDDDFNTGRVTRQRLIDRVIHDLINQVMQAHLAGRADVHGRAQPHRLQALENFDVVACVAAAIDRGRAGRGVVKKIICGHRLA